MKKFVFLLTIVSFTLFACKNPLKPDASQATTTSISAADSIPFAVAQSMIAHYLDTTVDHSLGSLVLQTTLHNSDLNEIFKLKKPITRLRLLLAAYLPTDSIVARRNKPTVLLQAKQGYNSNYYYYDVQAFGDGRLCPPPMGCSTIE
ncbi:MAG TPA: hypothetical protein VJ765_00525 [Chitinophagaceae bacterium]|nr:hypothetical protein [Chitinophagaceae bacterium]